MAFLIGFFVAAFVGYIVGRYSRPKQVPDLKVGAVRQTPPGG